MLNVGGVCGNGIIDDPRVARLQARLGVKVGNMFVSKQLTKVHTLIS